MPTKTDTTAKNTTAFAAQAAISFGASLFAMLVAVYFMEADPWVKGFLALGTLYLTTSTFTLAKVVRDMQEDNTVVHRLDAARLEKILAQHDPYKSAGPTRPGSSFRDEPPTGQFLSLRATDRGVTSRGCGG